MVKREALTSSCSFVVESTMRLPKVVSGPLYCLLWYLSILTGFYVLYAPLLPLLLINRALYRRLTDLIFVLWEAFNTALIEVVLGTEICVSGDLIRPEEKTLIILNHRTRLDWNFLWSALLHHQHCPMGHNTKLVLKDEVRAIPGLGYIMQMSRFVFIHRDWKRDEQKMTRMLRLLSLDVTKKESESQSKHGLQLVLFPEGTNLTKETRAKADAFADKMGRERLQHVLQPRTTGFSFLADKMRHLDMLDSIYDVSIGYPDVLPTEEISLMKGVVPQAIHFHFSRYSVKSDDVPSTVLGLERWLLELWQSKDCRLNSFASTRTLSTNRSGKVYKLLPFQQLSLIAWILFLYYTLNYVFLTLYGFLWLLSCTLLMLFVSKYTDGLNELECFLSGINDKDRDKEE